MIRFIISGGSAAAVHFALLYFLTDALSIWYLLSTTIAFVAAFTVSFTLQKFWTFRDRASNRVHVQIVWYLAVALGNLGLNTIGMYVLVNRLELWYIFAQGLTTATLAVESFFVYRYLIFHEEQGPFIPGTTILGSNDRGDSLWDSTPRDTL